jgi:hypothetical protein
LKTLKYTGQEVVFGEVTYTMPDLPYAAYEDYDAFEKIANIVRAMAEMEAAPLLRPLRKEVFADARFLLYLAISRNYPELTEDDFREQINPGNVLVALRKLIGRELEIQGIVKDVTEKNAEVQTEQAEKPKKNTQK